jgi:hypothetical protein
VAPTGRSITDGHRRAAGSGIVLDLDLLDAFEVAKETQAFVYAAAGTTAGP